MNPEIMGNDIPMNMGDDELGDNQEPNIPSDVNDMPEEENPYDSDFDAGVEADEEEDPKKFIEQLSGKLSQSLNSYQESLPQPDAETAKYAAGMIIKAAIKGLSQDDVTDILNKLKDTDEEEPTEDTDDDNDNEGMDDMPMDDSELEDNNMHESKHYDLNELFQELTNDKKEEIKEKPIKDISFKKKPFTSPKF